MNMATLQQSVWQQAARKRWGAVVGIVGDGPFAMHAACCQAGMVYLFHFAGEAVLAANEQCPHAFCKREHNAYQLTPVQQTTRQFQPAHSAGYGRD